MDTEYLIKEMLRLANQVKDSEVKNQDNYYEIWEGLINIKYELIGILEHMGIDKNDI